MRFYVVVLALLCLIGLTAPAFSQTNCADRERVTARLAGKYGEAFAGGGMKNAKAIFEVWTADTGTWTILMTLPNGVSCVMAAGTDWRDGLPPGEPG